MIKASGTPETAAKRTGPGTRLIRDVLITNWAVYTCSRFRVNGSALMTGMNESGKSTAIDAMVYAMFGMTDFNLQAGAGDDERSVYAYVVGDTKDNEDRYLRGGMDVTSWIAVDVYNPVDGTYLTEGVCIELFKNENRTRAQWFVQPGATIDDFNFYRKNGTAYEFTARQDLRCKGKKVRFFRKEEGIATFLRSCGLRLNADGIRQLRGKLRRLLACGKKKMDINAFIRDSIFEEDQSAADSLKNILRHREEYDELQKSLKVLSEEKELLQQIEDGYQVFVEKSAEMTRRRMAFARYRYMQQKNADDNTADRIDRALEQERVLEKQKKKAVRDEEKAEVAYSDARAAVVQRSAPVKQLENEIAELTREREAVEESLVALRSVRRKAMDIFGNERDVTVDPERLEIFNDISGTQSSADQITEELQHLEQERLSLRDHLDDRRIAITIRQKECGRKLEELGGEIRSLKLNRRILPPKMEPELEQFRALMKKEKRESEVSILADLVNDIDPRWQAAAEAFLAGRRFNILVNPEDVPSALRIIHDGKFSHLYLVMTNRMEEIPDLPPEGSLASKFTIANVYARKYVNYVCGNLLCVETLEELNDHPKGAIMADGMMAQGIVAHRLSPARDLVFGREAVQRLLASRMEEQKQQAAEKRQLDGELDSLRSRGVRINDVSFAPSLYDVTAPAVLPRIGKELAQKQKDLDGLKKDPSLKKLMDLEAAALTQLSEKKAVRTETETKLTQIRVKRENDEKVLADGRRTEKELFDAYDALAVQDPGEAAAAEALYEKQKNIQEDSIRHVITDLQGALERVKEQMTENMYRYNASHTGFAPGLAGIQKYLSRLDALRTRDIEEARNRVRAKEKTISDTFMRDFVEVIYARIRRMSDQKDAINRMLSRHAFGDKTYSILMREKKSSELAPFFAIAKKIDQLGGAGSLDVYLSMNRNFLQEGGMAEQFTDFRDTVFTAEDMAEYTDYRQYFTFDVRVQAADGHTAYLSNSQGIYSGGGKQTPYFILLAAALMTSYGSDACCLRPAFIDEAFAALDDSRIFSMIEYFNELGLQVFYAAPPEKMANISPYVGTTLAVVKKGRKADIIDGLVGV